MQDVNNGGNVFYGGGGQWRKGTYDNYLFNFYVNLKLL